MGTIYVVGIGPGDESLMTAQAKEAIRKCDCIIGYRVYTDLIRPLYPDKEVIESGMRQEYERCEKCIAMAESGKNVALICSGDPGVYGMASPMLEVALRNGFSDVVVIPGVTAALSGAADLGAAIGHDFCVISLSDLLTPWTVIEKRLRLAAEADLCIVIYNPSSKNRPGHLKKACEIMSTIIEPTRPCGFVRNIGRDETQKVICSFSELGDFKVDMFTTVFIGNSNTRFENGWLITPRGYEIQ